MDYKEIEKTLTEFDEFMKRNPSQKYAHLQSTAGLAYLQACTTLELKLSLDSLNAKIQDLKDTVNKAEEDQQAYSNKMLRVSKALNWYTFVIAIAAIATIVAQFYLQSKSFENDEIIQNQAYLNNFNIEKLSFLNDKKIQELSYRNSLALKGAHHEIGKTRYEFQNMREDDMEALLKLNWGESMSSNNSSYGKSGARKKTKIYDHQ